MNKAITVKWKSGEKWEQFDMSEIAHQSRDHAIRLFSGNIQVVAEERGTYVVNRPALQKQYQTRGKSCKLFAELQPSSEPLSKVGLVQKVC